MSLKQPLQAVGLCTIPILYTPLVCLNWQRREVLGGHRHINSRRQQNAWFACHSFSTVVLKGDKLMTERAWEEVGGSRRRVGGGLQSAREEEGVCRERGYTDRKTLCKQFSLTSVCLSESSAHWGGGAWRDEGALCTHLPLFLCVFRMFCLPATHTIKPLRDYSTTTHGVRGLRCGDGTSQAWLRVHVSIGRWVLPEAGYGDHGGAGLVSGPVGDHPDVPVCQRHGFQQGRTIYYYF